MKILVTGASGLIGSQLCKQLMIEGHYVIGIDNMSRSSTIPDCSKFIKLDISEGISIDYDVDIIYHLAAINGTSNFYNRPNDVISNNTRCDLSVFEYAKKCKDLKKMIYASSSEIKSHTHICKEDNYVEIDDISNPRWSYKISKMLSENYLHNSNIPWVIIRYFNVYGSESKEGHIVFDQIENHKNGVYQVIGSEETRCYTYVSDAVDATIKCIDKCHVKETINIGSKEELTSLEVAKIIGNYLNCNRIDYTIIEGRKGSTKRRVPDLTNLLRYYPNYSPIKFKEGILKVIENEQQK